MWSAPSLFAMTTKRKVGRPTTYTPEAAALVYQYLEDWCSLPDAFALSGVPETTGRRWMRDHAEFGLGVAQARARARQVAIAVLKNGSLGDSPSWQSGAWFLERTDFENWGRKERQELVGADGGPIVVVDR